MYATDVKLRVRYAETDQMGYVYYGHYASYYEVGRVEALRQLGFSYHSMEQTGVLMPVLSFRIDYLLPAHYDDVLRLRVCIPEMPRARIRFRYETYRDDELLNRGETVLFFLSADSKRPQRLPEPLAHVLVPYFEK